MVMSLCHDTVRVYLLKMAQAVTNVFSKKLGAKRCPNEFIVGSGDCTSGTVRAFGSHLANLYFPGSLVLFLQLCPVFLSESIVLILVPYLISDTYAHMYLKYLFII